jgi:hypothetical protein
VTCDNCGGDGEVDCECDCGHEHQAQCRDCDGNGDVPCPDCAGGRRQREVTPVVIGASMFDRGLLAEVLRAVPTTAAPLVWHDGELAASALAGEGWVVLVMPIRRDGREPVATFAAWEPEAEVAHA